MSNELYDHSDLFRTIYKGTDQPGYYSMAGWRQRSQQVREVLMQQRNKMTETISGLSKYYSDEIVKERSSALEADYRKLVNGAAKTIKMDFDVVMAQKREAHETSLDAPSDGQMRLLNALALRTKLTPADILAATRRCTDSLQALQVISDLAEKSGISFPRLTDSKEFSEAVRIATGWRDIAADDCGKPDESMGYFSQLFWKTSDNAGEFGAAFGTLDAPSWLSVTDDDLPQAITEAAEKGE